MLELPFVPVPERTRLPELESRLGRLSALVTLGLCSAAFPSFRSVTSAPSFHLLVFTFALSPPLCPPAPSLRLCAAAAAYSADPYLAGYYGAGPAAGAGMPGGPLAVSGMVPAAPGYGAAPYPAGYGAAAAPGYGAAPGYTASGYGYTGGYSY